VDVVDKGAWSTERTDYPYFASAVAQAIVEGDVEGGILICGTGVGISITANKFPGIRAVVCSEPYSAQLSRQHNNTNVLAFGSRVVGLELAKMIVDAWLNAEFEGGRHQTRVEAIAAIEQAKN
jgi:ribose 5-phosphate isomerase B